MAIIKHKDNFVPKMEEFFVAVSVDRDGSEGVLAFAKPNRFPPVVQVMCGATKEDLQSIKEYCQKVADEANRKVRVIKFSAREVIEEYLPKGSN
jgi:hypothetical protein